MDLQPVVNAIGRPTLLEIQKSDLPLVLVMPLLQMWEASSRSKLKALAAEHRLVGKLTKELSDALEAAEEIRGSNSHLTPRECLEAAGVPLTL